MPVITISGSPCAPSRCTALLAHVAALLHKSGVNTQALVVRDLPAEDILHGRSGSDAIKSAGELIETAQGIVIATPIYKGASSGVLKAFLDLLSQNALDGKVVLPIAVGGSSAHMLAVDYSLKPVLAALGATHVLGTVYAIDQQIRVTTGAQIDLDADIASRLQDGVKKFIRAAALPSHTSKGVQQLRPVPKHVAAPAI